MTKRVCCLYRVSTDKQVTYDDRHIADIPMQRKECHRFADLQGWEVVMEVQEDGVSGHKIRAENRDKIQTIKEAAKQKKFDILLVFMFDRIGRIADETPFVVEWFVKHGIEVWSTQEGEQRFDTHTDKLINYIRFWQADGESEKTSIRTRTRLGQLVEEGHFKGGNAPYGYRLVEGERLNRHKHHLFELEVVEEEAAVVRLIFDKYVNEWYGSQRITTFLNNHGYRARTGKYWHPATIRNIITNMTYAGILRSGESRSPVQAHLQIITEEQYKAAQEIRNSRHQNQQNGWVARNTRGQSLLAGNIYCAICGSRLIPTTNVKRNAAGQKIARLLYVCYGKKFKQTQCDGPSSYRMFRIDNTVDSVVRQVFTRMRSASREELIKGQYQKRVREANDQFEAAQRVYQESLEEIDRIKNEIVIALLGKSEFSSEVLSEVLAQREKKHAIVQTEFENAKLLQEHSKLLLEELEHQYDTALSFANMYDNASPDARKVIVSRMLERVEIGHDYKINIIFRPEYRGYFEFEDILQATIA